MDKTIISRQELTNIFYSRQYAYDILRRFFIEEPTRDYLKEFVQKNMIDFFPFKEDFQEIQEGVSEIKNYLAKHDVVNIEKHFQDLHWDYTKMFIGPFTLPTPPWESTYVRKDGLLFQSTTMEVRSTYKKYGFSANDFNIEADDHIGLELDFIFHLNESCLKVSESNEVLNIEVIQELMKEQLDFLDKHLLKFAPQLCKGMISEASTGLYKGMAMILERYLKIDSEVLQELLNMEN